ncbi:MAG: hypothetical protein EXS50_01325 [Candidatus Taylorbacteria bacterium]|nr:hypothetical protein [Candidatus Taylorbacteria bacterium]
MRKFFFTCVVFICIVPSSAFGQLTTTRPSTSSQGEYSIELDYPDYLPEYLKYPQKFFSGRKIKIVTKNGQSIAPQKTAQLKQYKNGSSSVVKKLDLKKGEEDDSLVTDIPTDISSGTYTIEFSSGGKTISIPIEITGSVSSKVSLKSITKTVLIDKAVTFVKRLNCGHCYWESVSGTNPQDLNYGYFFGGGSGDYMVQTNDGWITSNVYHINSLTKDGSAKYYSGDPIFAFNSIGKIILASLLVKDNEPITGGLYEEKKAFSIPIEFTQTILNPITEKVKEKGNWLIFDYPRIAIDNYKDSPFFNSIYVFANAVYFDDVDKDGTGLFVVRNGKISRYISDDLGFSQPPESAVVGPGGIIYISRSDIAEKGIYFSLDGGESFNKSIITKNSNSNFCTPRVSTQSDRSVTAQRGPELAVDKQGVVYAVWAEFKECISDSNFEYERYAYDYDVYSSSSHDKGKTWTKAVRVNDDVGSGNQFSPSIVVDGDGSLYVAFLDHRDNQDKGQFDVYLAKSTNGGVSFSKNIKVNDKSVPLVYGGREPGDYMYMLSVGKDSIFVAHPCVSTDSVNILYPSDACVSAVSKQWQIASVSLISSINSSSIKVGESVTIVGSSFVQGDKVIMSNRDIPSVAVDTTVIADNKLTFKIPTEFPTFCKNLPCNIPLPSGNYDVYVLSQDGTRSNSLPLMVTPNTTSTLAILTPKTDSILEYGVPYEIKWQSSGVSKVKIEILDIPGGNVVKEVTAPEGILNRNSLIWTPEQPGFSGHLFWLRISDKDNSVTKSQISFQIKAPVPAVVTKVIPSFGDPGDIIVINGSGFDRSRFKDKDVYAYLNNKDRQQFSYFSSTKVQPKSDTVIEFKIPSFMTQCFATGKCVENIATLDGEYTLSVTGTEKTVSIIVGKPKNIINDVSSLMINIISPILDDILEKGKSYYIKYKAEGILKLKIDLMDSKGNKVIRNIEPNATGKYTYYWDVPQDIDIERDNLFTIRISDANNPKNQSKSGKFTIIDRNDPGVQVTSNTFSIQYDSINKESSLLSKMMLKVTASKDIDLFIPKRSAFLVGALNTGNQWGLPDEVLYISDARDYGPNLYRIAKGKSASVTITTRFNPKKMFAGSYRAYVNGFAYGVNFEDFRSVPVNFSNPVTIIGETSPYILDTVPNANPPRIDQSVRFIGERFGSMTLGVMIGDKKISVTPKRNLSSGNDYFEFVPIEQGIDAGWTVVQVLNPTEGDSNKFFVEFAPAQRAQAAIFSWISQVAGVFAALGDFLNPFNIGTQ